METKNWMSATAVGAIILLGSSACSTDWGKMDPPAGISTYPKLENIATYEFEDDNLDPMIFKAKGAEANQLPAIAEDEAKGRVLELNDGWVETNNPLTQATCEKAASITFWMKQIPAVTIDDDGNENVEPQDLTSPLLVFLNENRTSHFSITANGWLEYDAADGSWSDNNPADASTGYMPAGQWNYVALTMRDNGYDLYVNGEKKSSKNVDNFDCSKIVAFVNNVPTMTIGSPDNHGHWMIDDLKLYRNELTAKEITRPRLPGEGAGPGQTGPDLSKWLLVGLEDNSTVFWTEFSPYLSLTGDGEIHYEFYNYTDGLENWTNWLAVIATGERGSDGYHEYAVVRADNFGWGDNWGSATTSCDFNFDTFKQDMQGAHVDITIERSGEEVDVTAIVTTAAGTVYNYKVNIPGITTPSITTWLLCERAHLLLNPEGCFVGTIHNGDMNTGAQDFSTPFWGAHSPGNKLTGDFSNFGFEFINHNTGLGSNWHNWVLVCTNGTYLGEDGYAELFVSRSDAYGWGALYDAKQVTCTHGYNWETYVSEMHDATVRIYVERFGSDITIVVRETKADGTRLPEQRILVEGVETPAINLFFTVDSSWLEFRKVGFFPMISMNPEN